MSMPIITVQDGDLPTFDLLRSSVHCVRRRKRRLPLSRLPRAGIATRDSAGHGSCRGIRSMNKKGRRQVSGAFLTLDLVLLSYWRLRVPRMLLLITMMARKRAEITAGGRTSRGRGIVILPLSF